MQDINLKITDRNGETHEVVAPTDMSMNLMEVIRSYELAEEGTIGVCGGMAMCASCQVYVLEGSEKLVEMGDLIPIKDISLLLGPEYQKDEEMLNLNIHV